jgi:hypothetical protein
MSQRASETYIPVDSSDSTEYVSISPSATGSVRPSSPFKVDTSAFTTRYLRCHLQLGINIYIYIYISSFGPVALYAGKCLVPSSTRDTNIQLENPQNIYKRLGSSSRFFVRLLHRIKRHKGQCCRIYLDQLNGLDSKSANWKPDAAWSVKSGASTIPKQWTSITI